MTDPKLVISTRIRLTDGLDHNAAVQYEVDALQGPTPLPALRLPEDYNGLGYQNLISMIFSRDSGLFGINNDYDICREKGR